MVNETDNNFTWVIKGFSSQSKLIYTDSFVTGGCKWFLIAFPKGFNADCLSLFLRVADYELLPLGWRRQANVSLKLVNQFSEKCSITREATQYWFDQKSPILCFQKFLPLKKLHSKDGGFLVNDELKIVVEVDVLEVLGESKRSQEATQPMKKIKTNDYGTGHKTVDVNGFQVSPSQVESVGCIFERHPDFASKVRSNNQHLKSTYMNVTLGLLETLCKLPEELSDDDLDEASAAVLYVTNVGFKVDWLEKKLEEVTEKKKKVNTGKTLLQHMDEEFEKHNAEMLQMDEELEKLNKKCLDLKVLMEKETANVSAANVPFSFDDVV